MCNILCDIGLVSCAMCMFIFIMRKYISGSDQQWDHHGGSRDFVQQGAGQSDEPQTKITGRQHTINSFLHIRPVLQCHITKSVYSVRASREIQPLQFAVRTAPRVLTSVTLVSTPIIASITAHTAGRSGGTIPFNSWGTVLLF